MVALLLMNVRRFEFFNKRGLILGVLRDFRSVYEILGGVGPLPRSIEIYSEKKNCKINFDQTD